MFNGFGDCKHIYDILVETNGVGLSRTDKSDNCCLSIKDDNIVVLRVISGVGLYQKWGV